VTLLYLVASDLFHVVGLVSYLEMLRAYDGGGLVGDCGRKKAKCGDSSLRSE